ncbi:MAG TPA: hypothetical protein VLE53_01735 [Gemmatimonadaceae bacterium]|nr:hypothetical protein [Gemmatimonadaceae bacterium]
MRLTRCWLASAAVVVAAGPVYAQNIPTRALTRPDVEYGEPFTQVTGVRELRDGRVIVTDPRDKVVQVVDLRAGTAEKIGREGSGPGEYAMPLRLFALPGDSSAVADMLNRRMLVITPTAEPGGFIDLNSPAAGRRGAGGPVLAGGPTNITAVDNRGRMYLQGSPFRLVDGQPQAADSVSIERWDRVSGQRDTVAWLQLPKGSTQISGGSGGRMLIRTGGTGMPFSTQDQFAVAPDGRIAIVHHDPYSVEFVSAAGMRTKGQPIRHDRIRLTEKHKEQWRDQQRSATGMMITNNNGRQSAQMAPMPFQEPTEWPEYLPAFLPQSALFAPDGLLWVRRTTSADAPPTYDLIDGAGRVTQRVTLAPRSRVVGFGNGAVYVVRLDEDDLQYLQRHRFTGSDRQ